MGKELQDYLAHLKQSRSFRSIATDVNVSGSAVTMWGKGWRNPQDYEVKVKLTGLDPKYSRMNELKTELGLQPIQESTPLLLSTLDELERIQARMLRDMLRLQGIAQELRSMIQPPHPQE